MYSAGGLLYPGDPLQLRLRFKIPEASRSYRKIYLDALRLSLVDLSILKIRKRRLVDLTGKIMQEVSTRLPLEAPPATDLLEIDPVWWHGCRIPYTLCATGSYFQAGKDLLLQILCAFSFDDTGSSSVSYHIIFLGKSLSADITFSFLAC